MEPLFFIVIALIIGAATRHFLKKTPLPYTVLLMIFGIGLGLLVRFFGVEVGHGHEEHGHMGVWDKIVHAFMMAIKWAGEIDPHVILFVFLPILIFEAAFAMDVHTFKKSVGNASLLAIPGILIALFLTGFLVAGLSKANIGFKDWVTPEMGFSLAFLFGAVVSATDPVAVVALLKELGASKKLGTLIEGESLLNDGTAIVLFFVFLALIAESFGLHIHTSGLPVVAEFFRVALGGVLLGAIIGGIILVWVKKVFNDAMIEITLIVVAAYLVFYVAEHFLHVSGVLGLVALGLAMASAGRTRISAEVQHFLHEFWELAAFIANTLIFVIVGVVIAERSSFTGNDFLALIILYVGIHIIRAIVILIFFPAMRKIGYGLPKKDAIVAWYGGLRGAVGLALALVFVGELAKSEHITPAQQLIADQFLFYISGIVALTLLVNATTIKFVVKKLGLTDIPPIKAVMFQNAFKAINQDAQKELEVIQNDRFMGGADWAEVKDYLPKRTAPEISEKDVAEMDPVAEARRRILEKEKRSYWNQYKEGLLGPMAFTKLADNINEIIDKNGEAPLTDRDYLNSLWRTPKLLTSLQNFPVFSGWARNRLIERLGVSYDVARGFVVSQEEVSKLVANMDFDFNQDDVKDEEEERMEQQLKTEVNDNRLRGLNYIKEIHQGFPEITKSIETRQAARTVLNHERSAISKMNKEGRIEDDEATRMILDVERRMKKLMDAPLVMKMQEPVEVLKQVSWLKGVTEGVIQKVVRVAEEKTHNPGQALISQGESGDSGMVVIARGSVKVLVGDVLVDLMGAGSVIGEMSVLAGVPRTANVVADTPVTAFWLSSKDMRVLLKESDVLEKNIWTTAALRFAENLLGQVEPFRQWSQIKMRRWLSQGEIIKTHDDQHIKFQNKVGVLISGAASDKESSHIFQSPCVIDTTEAVFSDNAWVFVSGSTLDV
jgi:NhaP-type Na+/H+ or K+/H+ antiporter